MGIFFRCVQLVKLAGQFDAVTHNNTYSLTIVICLLWKLFTCILRSNYISTASFELQTKRNTSRLNNMISEHLALKTHNIVL